MLWIPILDIEWTEYLYKKYKYPYLMFDCLIWLFAQSILFIKHSIDVKHQIKILLIPFIVTEFNLPTLANITLANITLANKYLSLALVIFVNQ